MKDWLLSLLSDDLSWDNPQILSNTHFIMELCEDPVSLYLFLIGSFYLPIDDWTTDSIDRWEDISFIDSDDYHIMGIYNISCSLSKPKYSSAGAWIIKRSQEVLAKGKETANKLEALLSS